MTFVVAAVIREGKSIVWPGLPKLPSYAMDIPIRIEVMCIEQPEGIPRN
jgi:hypothetical protein